MKLRCISNSIRIRIRKSELQSLDNERIVKETIAFGNGVVFTYSLEIDENINHVTATFLNHQLAVRLPLATANNWINSDEIGIEASNTLNNGEQLHLLVEKDFPCTDRPEEDKSDTFWELTSKKPDAC